MKVCDFGLSIVKKKNLTDSEEAQAKSDFLYGTPGYSAPELTMQNHTNKVDVFSFGVMYIFFLFSYISELFLLKFESLWEIFTRTIPWTKYQISSQILEAVQNGERNPLPENCPTANLISSCWVNFRI